jgi:hypothetical protein
MIDSPQTDGRVRKRVGISLLLVFLLSPFLISGGFALMLALLGGLLRLLDLVGLTEWVWPFYCVGIFAVVPVGFLIAVKIGRILLGESMPRFQFRIRRFMTWTVVLAAGLAALVAVDREGQASGCGYPLLFAIWVVLLAAIGYVVIRVLIFGIRHPS